MSVEESFLIKLMQLSIISAIVSCQKHYFLRQPFNTTVRTGETARLRCAIANKQTDVQWSVDNFGLGLRFLDPRLSYYGSKSSGEYNLEIVDVQLSDDGIYRCQANANYNMGIPPLQSRGAYLNVVVPPKTIILEPVASELISVSYPDSIAITCTVPDTKPAAVIGWKVGGKTYASGPISKKMITKKGSKLVTASSSITIKPDKLQNGSSVECVVNHAGIDTPITRMAALNVLYPPSLIKISGFKSYDHPMKSGEEPVLSCKVSGGNPTANITWLINNKVIHTESQRTSDGSQSLLRYKVRPQDDGKKLLCRAESPALDAPMEDHVTLQVHYPPKKIIIERHPEDGAKEHSAVTFRCHCARSNPRCSLAWYIEDEKLPLHWNIASGFIPYVIQSQKNKSPVNQIILKLTSVRRVDAGLKIKCKALIPEINYSGEASTYPKIKYSARKVDLTISSISYPVTISSKDKEPAYKAGDVLLMQCEVKGGNPAPNPMWYLNDKKISNDQDTTISDPDVKVYTGSSVDGAVPGEFISTTTLELTLKQKHNAAIISCSTDTLSKKKTLRVAFPPTSISIGQFPSSLVTGKPVNLTCTTSSSNPAAKITWYRNGNKLPEHFSENLPSTDGSMGGNVARSRLQIIPEIEDDRSDITCKADVEVLQQSVMQHHNLRVEYPPRFFPTNGNRSSFNATEGDKYIDMEVVAHSNPSEIKFSFYRIRQRENSKSASNIVKEPLTKNGRFVWTEDSGRLRINNLRRKDDGIYIVEASNSIGTTSMSITLNVFYSPKIVDMVGPNQLLVEGDSTQLRCNFASHPALATKVSWIKKTPGSGRPTYDVTNFQTHSILFLDNITSKDRGGYQCIAENDIGVANSAQVTIVMKYSPVFDDTAPNKVAISSVDESGRLESPVILPCIAHARPKATLSWTLGNETIVPNKKNGYSITHRKSDDKSVQSYLAVSIIPVNHEKPWHRDVLAEYHCNATNSQGKNLKTVQIVLRGAPDAPSSLSVFNVSDAEIQITWKEGFDGGDDQKFVIQYADYKKHLTSGKYHEDIVETNQAVITNLAPNTEYLIRVVAKNRYGLSKPSEHIKIRTAATSFLLNTTGGVFGVGKANVIVFAVITMAVLILFFTIAACILRHKISRQTYKPKTTETNFDSLKRAQSTLSFCDSRGNEEEQIGETMRLTKDVESRVAQLDRKDFITTMVPLEAIERDQTCYLDCSISRCSSHHSVGRCLLDLKYTLGATCSFPTFRDDNLGESTPQPPVVRSIFPSHSARLQRSEDCLLPRTATAPRYRHEVQSRYDSSTNVGDEWNEKCLYLPPTLPLYKNRTYEERSFKGSSGGCIANTENTLPHSGYAHEKYRSEYQKYTTLQPTGLTVDTNYKDYCSDPLEGRSSISHSDDGLQKQAASNKIAKTCLYNVVADHSDTHTDSLASMSKNTRDEYIVEVQERHRDSNRVRESWSSSSSSNSGLYVKSLENTINIPNAKTHAMKNQDYSSSSQNIQADDLSPARCFKRKDQLKYMTSVSTAQNKRLFQTVQFCNDPTRGNDYSDNDTDSGCGGSADVAVQSPAFPEPYSSSLFPFSSDGEGIELHV